MPKIYSEEERSEIVRRLKNGADELIREKGVKKTTVDELVRRVGIPKGTFYLFYPSKEMLLFECAQDLHEQVNAHITQGMETIIGNKKTDKTDLSGYAEEVTDVIMGAIEITQNSCLRVLLEPQSMALILDKLPEDVLKECILNELGDKNHYQQENGHRAGKTDLLAGMRYVIHNDEERRGSVGTGSNDIGRLKRRKGAGYGKNDIQGDDGLNGGQDNVAEGLPLIGAVQRGRFIKGIVHRHHSAQEKDHVRTHIAPDRSEDQGPVIDALVLEPIGKILQIKADRLKHCIQNEPSSIKKLEDKADGDSVDQIRKKDKSFPEIFTLYLKAEDRCKIECQGHLHNRSHHIVKGQEQCPDDIRSGKDLDIVPETNEFPRTDILHVVETVPDHFQEGIIGKQDKQKQRHYGKRYDDLQLSFFSGIPSF